MESNPLKPQPCLTSGSVTNIPIFVTETQASSVTPTKYIQDIFPPSSPIRILFHTLNLIFAVQVVTEINSCLYQSPKESIGAWQRQSCFSVAQIPENTAKCKTTFWV